MAPFEIRVLGRFVVLRDGEEVPAAAFGGRLARRLLRLLVVRRGDHVSKEVLADALWPQRAPSDPAANLEVLVSRVRRALGDPSLIVTGPGGYSFARDDRCRVDAEEVVGFVRTGRDRIGADPNAALEAFEAAVARWGGEPLAEDLYEDWAAPRRSALDEALQSALEGAAEAALALGDPRRAVGHAAAAARREPLREASTLLLVRALATSGDPAGALEAFEAFRARYAEELGLDPSEEAAALHASVLRGELVTATGRGEPVLAPTAGPVELPFVGRDDELDLALRWDERVVLVSGSSGAGKSRFLDELARRSPLPVIRAGAVLPERDEPWSLVRALLREAIALEARALAGVPRLAAAALLDVLPELAELGVEPAAIDRPARRALAIEAATALLRTAVGPGAVLLVDDAQWADGTSLHVLATGAARVDALHLGLAYRSEEIRAGGAAEAFLADVRRQPGARTLELGPLPHDALERLAGDAIVAEALESEGSAAPIEVAAVLRALEESGAIAVDATGTRRPVRPIERTEAVEAARVGRRRALEGRLARVGRREVAVLQVLSALGREVSAATVGAAARLEPAEALEALDRLTRAGLARLGDAGWATSHDSVGEVVTAAMEPARRARVHLDVAAALEAEEAEPSEVAPHLAAAGEARRASVRFVEAAERALSRFANEECLRLVEPALALTASERDRAEVLAIRAEARARRGDLAGAKVDLREAVGATPDGPERAGLLTRLAMLESGSEDYAAAARLIELALTAAGEDPRRRAEAHAAGSIVDLNLGDLERSELRANTALELFEANGDARGAAGILDGRAMATFLGGRIREAADAFDRVARLFRDAGELLRVGTPRSTRGHALIFLGRPDEGLLDVDDALELSIPLGHAEGESYSRWHRAEALAALGRAAEAVSEATEALAIAERIQHREWTAASLRGLGIALEAAGDLEAAGEAHRRGLDAAAGMPLFATWAAARLASCLVRLGRLGEAERALAAAQPERTPLGAYEARLAEAELRAARGDPEAPTSAAAAAELAEDGGHLVSAARLRELAAG